MNFLIDGLVIAEKIEAKTARKVAELKAAGVVPKLAVVLVGEHRPSRVYIERKAKAAARVGMDFVLSELPADISKREIIAHLHELQADPTLSGVIVQLPLPEPLYTGEVLNAIDPARDVDCLTDANLGRLVMKTGWLLPPTPGAVLAILDHLGVGLAGKNITIIGAGALVGKPMAIIAMNERASVTTVNSSTRAVTEKCLAADVIVTGVGKAGLVTADMVSPGAIVIDTGISFVNGKMTGDVAALEIAAKGTWVTPTPGGVGPITVSLLLWNTAIAAERRAKKG